MRAMIGYACELPIIRLRTVAMINDYAARLHATDNHDNRKQSRSVFAFLFHLSVLCDNQSLIKQN